MDKVFNRSGDLQFQKVTEAGQFAELAELAREIWQQHYPPIIGQSQVDYMLEKFHSTSAMQQQAEAEGMAFFLVIKESKPLGYLAFKADGEHLFLSKFYLLSACRGQGYGARMLNFCADQARALGLKAIRLTVNKNNRKSIQAYLKMGFDLKRAVKIDIGEAYIMDDFELEKIIE